MSQPPFASLNVGRSAGDDQLAVDENEKRLVAGLEVPGEMARARLSHGKDCVAVDGPGIYEDHDGLVTSSERLALWLTVADCYPLFVSGDDCVGLAHCGWRGVAAGIVGRLVEAMSTSCGAARPRMRAWIGPGVRACCYPVSRDVAERFAPRHRRSSGDQDHLDLEGAIRVDLAAAGVPPDGIDSSELCTSCRSDLFFSRRRDGSRSGRMAAVIWLDRLERS